MTELLAETQQTTTVTEAAGGTISVELINPGWGSSGYYSAQVLEAAGRDRVFPAGTHMYLDHPSQSEQRDRPERSLRDLAAVLTEDATWNGGALVANARVFAPYQPLIAEMADHIGVSIRASGDVELGEAEGRKGRIVTALVEGTSADFVTHAGRGGRIAQLLESARPTRDHLAEARNIGQWVESAIHRDFTVMADDMAADGRLTRDERITLSGAIGDALAAFVTSLEANAPQLYQRDLWDEPTAPAVSEGAPAPHNSTPPKEALVAELSEAEVTALRTSVTEAEAARDIALAEARTASDKLALLEAKDTTRPVVAAKVAESKTLGARTQARVVESVLGCLPMAEGKVDDTKLPAVIESAVKAAEAEIADYKATASTSVFGSYGSVTEAGTSEGTALTESDIDASVGSAFGRKGTN